jgi:putative tryptophan/tyrosine transport system substrate-binding protein
MGLLVNPGNSTKVQLIVLDASAEGEIDAAFGTFGERHVEALLIGNDAFFNSQRERLIALAARYRIPASYEAGESVRAGGLMSYGANIQAMYRQLGIYTAKVLKGTKPADLPVEQPTKFEPAINLKTAKALGLIVPRSLLVAADEVTE